MTDRRVLTIRFWLLAAASLLVIFLSPATAIYLFASFAFTPLGLMIPVFAAAGCGPACTGSAAASITIVITGFVDGSCSNCDTVVNGTFNIATNGFCVAIACSGGGQAGFACTNFINIAWRYKIPASNTILEVAVANGGCFDLGVDYRAFYEFDLGAGPIDCAASRGPDTLTFISEDNPGHCVGSGATVTATV